MLNLFEGETEMVAVGDYVVCPVCGGKARVVYVADMESDASSSVRNGIFMAQEA